MDGFDDFLLNRWTGDLGLITKERPRNHASAFAELYTNADNYTIAFDPSANLTAAQKATLLASQLLADYMYFDGNTEKCRRDNNGCTIYCWYCSIIGWIAPCSIRFQTRASTTD